MPLLHFASLPSCHLLGFRQSHSALTLPSDDAYAIAAADANQAILLPALSSVISNVLLLQASCQARHPSRTHSQSICICHSPLLLTTPARPSTTAMPNYSELHANKVSDILLVQAKASFAKIRRGARCCTAPGGCQLARCVRAAAAGQQPPSARVQYEPFSKTGCTPTRMECIRATLQGAP